MSLLTQHNSIECHYDECRYTECRDFSFYAECRYAECHYAECRYTACHGAILKLGYCRHFKVLKLSLG
jgi:hypothetical protein